MFQVRASEVGRLGPKTRSSGAVERLTPWHPIWIGMFVEKYALQAQSSPSIAFFVFSLPVLP